MTHVWVIYDTKQVVVAVATDRLAAEKKIDWLDRTHRFKQSFVAKHHSLIDEPTAQAELDRLDAAEVALAKLTPEDRAALGLRCP